MKPAGFLLRGAGTVVRVAAYLAPRAQRDRFLREWEGELAGENDTASGWRLLRDAFGAFADAWALRAMTRNGNGNGEGTMGHWIGGFVADVAVTLRSMRRAPGFTAVAVTTLALGLGGSAALYALLDRVVLQPLPYPEAERLVRLDNQVPGVGPNEIWGMSTAQWAFFTDQATTLEDVGIYRGRGGNVMTSSGPQRARGISVTASMMGLLGARSVVGRLITADDDLPGAPLVTVLSYGFWQRVLGGDLAVVGTTLTYDDQPVEIVGVMERGVELPGWPSDMEPDMWLPMRVDRGGVFYSNHVFAGIARMAPRATPESVEQEIALLTPRLPDQFPQAYGRRFIEGVGFHTQVTPLKESVLGDLAQNLWIIFGGVALVLLIACTNVANLFMVRMEGRLHELGVRSALGASRTALGRQVLAEGMTLAFLGAGGGILAGYWAVPILTTLAPAQLPRVHGATLTSAAVAYTLIVAVGVGLLLAAYPMLAHLGHGRLLSGEGRSVTAGRKRQRVRSAMVVTQVALALTLVVGASLLLESMAALRHADAGIEAEGVLALDLYLSYTRHGNDAAVWNAYSDILARVEALPGVASAGMSEELPVSGGFGCTVQAFEDETVYAALTEKDQTTCAGQEATSPGYFESLGIPVLEGRSFTDQDNNDPGRAAVVVSKAFAERFWPGRSALGQGVSPNGNSDGPFYHVVGVVDDVTRASTEGEAPLSQPAMAVYYPVRHNPASERARNWWPGAMSMVVKTEVADPTSLFPAIRRIIQEVDPEIPVANLTEMDAIVAQATAQLGFVSLLLGIAAATALLLAGVGLYGVISYLVARRTREIGMRMAVGAQPGDVQRMVVGRAMALAGAGLALGVALAFGVSTVLDGLVVGLEPTGPSTYTLSAVILASVALLASWIPARRASRIDPVEALRLE